MARRTVQRPIKEVYAELLAGVDYELLAFDFPSEGRQCAFHYKVMPVLLYDGTGSRAKVCCNDPERVREIANFCGGVEVEI